MVFSDETGSTVVVDVHAHTVPASLAEAAREGGTWYGVPVRRREDGKVQWERGGSQETLTWGDPGGAYERRLADMDAQEVDVHVLSHSPLMFWYDLEPGAAVAMAQEINDTIAGVVEKWPTRFQGLAYLPLQAPERAAEELQRAVGGLGLAGAVVGTHVAGRDWDTHALLPVLEAAQDLDTLVFLHPSSSRCPTPDHDYHLPNVIGNPVETSTAVGSMIFAGVFDRLPRLKLLLAHGGGYVCLGLGRHDHAARVRKECQGISRLPSEYARELHYDSLTHNHHALRFLIDEVGISQIVLGTDYPADMQQSDPVRWLRDADMLTGDERLDVLGRNAVRLLGDRAAAFASP